MDLRKYIKTDKDLKKQFILLLMGHYSINHLLFTTILLLEKQEIL